MSKAFEDPSLDRYIERIRKLPLLDREAEHELAVCARAGDPDAAHRLVEANLRYVVAIALQYRRYGIRLGDLIAEGSLGLVTAVGKFDPDRGTRFVTYAGYWIRAYVLEAVVRSSSLVGAGSGPFRSKIFFRLRRERARLTNLIADPTARMEALAERFDTTPEKIEGLLRRLDAKDLSLDAPVHDEGDGTLLDGLRAEGMPVDERLDEEARDAALRVELDRALDGLDRRERFIVERRLLAEDETSLADLGRELGVSRERARQLEARAKTKLQKRLEAFRSAA